jgi:hypothetical protein
MVYIELNYGIWHVNFVGKFMFCFKFLPYRLRERGEVSCGNLSRDVRLLARN